jgi:hypothetical protein
MYWCVCIDFQSDGRMWEATHAIRSVPHPNGSTSSKAVVGWSADWPADQYTSDKAPSKKLTRLAISRPSLRRGGLPDMHFTLPLCAERTASHQRTPEMGNKNSINPSIQPWISHSASGSFGAKSSFRTRRHLNYTFVRKGRLYCVRPPPQLTVQI